MVGVTDAVTDWMRRFEEGLDNGVYQTASDIAEASKPIIAAEAMDTHALLESTEVAQVARFHWQTRWTADHAPYENYGTRPHMPPFEPILAWVKRNVRLGAHVTDEGPTLGPIVKPKAKRGTKKLADADARAIAWAICQKIAKVGTEPVNFKERASAIGMQNFEKNLEESVAHALKGNPAAVS